MNAKKKEKAVRDYANVPSEDLVQALTESKDFNEAEIAEIVKALSEPEKVTFKVKQHQIKKDYQINGIALEDWEAYQEAYLQNPAYKMIEHVKVSAKPVFKNVRDEDENVYRALVGVELTKNTIEGATLIAPETAAVLNDQIVNYGVQGGFYYLAKDLIEL